MLVAPPVGLRPPYAATSTNSAPVIPVTLLDEGGPFCTPIGGPFWTPIDTLATWARGHAAQAPDDRLRAHDADLYEALAWWQDSDGDCPRIVLFGLIDRRNPVARWTPSRDDEPILRAFGLIEQRAKAA